MTHAEARAILLRTRPAGAGPRAVTLAQTVALHETGYGRGWRSCPGMEQSHNWGAIQGQPGVRCRDTHADGSSYRAPYRVYASDDEGAAALWRELWRRPRVRRVLLDDAIDTSALATAMRADGYYEASLKSYRTALARALDRIRRGA